MSDLSERLRAAHATCIRDGWHGPEILLEAAVAAARLDYLTSVEGRRDWLAEFNGLSIEDVEATGYVWPGDCGPQWFSMIAQMAKGEFLRDRISWFLRSPPEVQAAVCRLVDAKLEAKRQT